METDSMLLVNSFVQHRLYDSQLAKFDAYPKIKEDFYSLSLSSGVITIVSSIVMILLFFSELRLYVHPAIQTKLVVDTSRGDTLRINFDVTFPAVACSILSLDAMDISGEQHLDVKHDIVKKWLDAHGNVIEVRPGGIGILKIEKPLQRHGGRLGHNETYCGSCYGAEEVYLLFVLSILFISISKADDQCCNSCEDVRDASETKIQLPESLHFDSQDGKGSYFSKIRFAICLDQYPRRQLSMLFQCKREGFLQKIKDEEGEGCNIYGSLEVNKLSHKINILSFGDSFPGVMNPLDGVQWMQKEPIGMYQYFIKVVPTMYSDVSGHTIESNQFSVTEHYKGADIGFLDTPTGVFFIYDLSPIKVTFTEQHVSFLHFLTNVCAIVGGVAGITWSQSNEKEDGHR
ncbi:GDSL esterase/lipase [Hibiscus syriacus]|uniref:GDSL esterase/lipase n=1 Tax=Hibiscus syriacus TaxID=106335 RepID=A0A6A3BFN2_HIBSY|nr:GDSL esterase/lipase [Hibiscus syriacus]